MLEQILLDGTVSGEKILNGALSLIPIQTDSFFVISSNWGGETVGDATIQKGSFCDSKFECRLTGKIVSNETVTVPAGTFDTQKIEFNVVVNTKMSSSIHILVWYSREHKRTVRQVVRVSDDGAERTLPELGGSTSETIELIAIRQPR